MLCYVLTCKLQNASQQRGWHTCYCHLWTACHYQYHSYWHPFQDCAELLLLLIIILSDGVRPTKPVEPTTKSNTFIFTCILSNSCLLRSAELYFIICCVTDICKWVAYLRVFVFHLQNLKNFSWVLCIAIWLMLGLHSPEVSQKFWFTVDMHL